MRSVLEISRIEKNRIYRRDFDDTEKYELWFGNRFACLFSWLCRMSMKNRDRNEVFYFTDASFCPSGIFFNDDVRVNTCHKLHVRGTPG